MPTGGTVKLRRSSQNTGARTVVMPRWSRYAIAPPLLIGRSEASNGLSFRAGPRSSKPLSSVGESV
jgi:hypothetical protein